MKKISSLKCSKLVSIESNASVEEAVKLMHLEEVNLLVVTEEGRGRKEVLNASFN